MMTSPISSDLLGRAAGLDLGDGERTLPDRDRHAEGDREERGGEDEVHDHAGEQHAHADPDRAAVEGTRQRQIDLSLGRCPARAVA